MRAIVCAALAVLLLAGCQADYALRGISDLTRELRGKQVSFELNQEVEIPPGRARLFLQDGSVVGARNFYRPHCNLMIDSVDHTGFPVAAEIFNVVRIQRSTVQIAALRDVRLAGLITAFGSYDSGTDRFHDGYHFWLVSEAQPAVMRLTCYGVFAHPVDLRPPTLEDINAALRDVGALRVADVGEP